MSAELASASILEHFAESGFRASVLTSYTTYFPFYEEVVLRRLIAAGCAHNVLMVDAARCAEAFASEELRPRRAGRDYTLIPVHTGGAFHPKLFLRLGKTKGSLLVGSHNVTLSGFGVNDEVTNVFELAGAALRAGGAPFHQALTYFEQFVPKALAGVMEAFDGVRRVAPWLDGPLGVSSERRHLLAASSTGADLWSQMLPLIPPNVATAFVGGPFFDPTLAMVRRLQRELQPARLVVGIDPESVAIDPAEAAQLERVEWVNIRGVARIPQRRDGAPRNLHAKIFWFAGSAGEELLVTGSANPSVAAFFAAPGARNAEAVMADGTPGAGERIGMAALLAAPAVSSSEWQAVAARQPLRAEARPEEAKYRVLVATPDQSGFVPSQGLEAGMTLRAFGDGGALLGEALASADGLLVAEDLVRDGARFLESRETMPQTLVVVHRTEDIARNLGGDTRKALRQALGALEDDPTQLEALLRLTEKVIFDGDDVVRTTPARSGSNSAGADDGMAPGPDSLALDAQGRRSGAGQRARSLASGDIVVLLDALVHRLGEGLACSNAASRLRSEEESVGSDDEDDTDSTLRPDAPDVEQLAKACRSKVRRLLNRMKGQLERAAAPDGARRAVVQLAAVLGVLRALRCVEQRPEWKRGHRELVDRDDGWAFFQIAATAFAWGPHALAPRAVAEADGVGFAELSMVVGLLAWLAWDVKTDVVAASHWVAEEDDAERPPWLAVQLFVLLGPSIVDDVSAQHILEESVSRTPRFRIDGDRWIRAHREALRAFARVCASPDEFGQRGRESVARGDLVILESGEEPRVRIVLEVGLGRSGQHVVMFDPGRGTGTRTFLAGRVPTLAWDIPHPGNVAARAG